MKNNFKYLLLIILLSLLPFTAMIVNPLLPHTQDGLVHLARMAAHFKALTDGQFPPRWAADLNYGYGMPLFTFMYPLPYFLTSLFIFLGANLTLAFKLITVLSFILSGIFMYHFSLELFKKEKTALWTTIFYQFAPFRLVEANIRGDIGEIYTYTFLPLVLWAILKEKWILSSIATALLILSHNSISLVFFAVAAGFVFFFSQNKKRLLYGLLSLGMGLTLSAFYWLPALWEHKFTLGNLFMQNVYKEYFTPLYKLFLPNLTNSQNLNMGDVPVQIGMFHVIILILAMTILLRHIVVPAKAGIRMLKQVQHDNIKIFFFSFFIFLFSIYFTQPISVIFWEKISLLRQFQFPWRFLAPMVFATALCSGIVFTAFKSLTNIRFIIFIIFITVISTFSYWQTPFGYDKIKDSDYYNYPLTTTYYGETDVIWSAGPQDKYPDEKVEIIGGKGKINNFNRQPTMHIFKILAQTPVSIIDNTQYFPGWRVFANGREIPIQFQDENHRGLITFNLPAGDYEIKVIFGKTKDRLISEIISGVSFLLWLVFIVVKATPLPPSLSRGFSKGWPCEIPRGISGFPLSRE